MTKNVEPRLTDCEIGSVPPSISPACVDLVNAVAGIVADCVISDKPVKVSVPTDTEWEWDSSEVVLVDGIPYRVSLKHGEQEVARYCVELVFGTRLPLKPL